MAATAKGTQPASIVPQPGHWEGSNPPVSFDVTADGKISNFHIVAPFKFDFPNSPKLSTCDYDVKEIEVNADSSFRVSYLSDFSEFGLSAADVSTLTENWGIKPDANGKYELRHVQGQFTTTITVAGKVQVLACDKAAAFNAETSWSAELKTPLQATPAPTAAVTMVATMAATTTNASSGPKPGRWEGSTPPVSFDVTNDGKIHNFRIAIPFVGIGTCNIEETEIAIQADGSFKFEKTVEDPIGGTDTQSIGGKFDNSTHVTGSTVVAVCQKTRTMDFSKLRTKWSADWKQS